jgi:hypothetical protein
MPRLVLVASLILTGCASTHVVSTGKNTYLASVRFCGVCTAAVVATQAAADYCAERGQVSTVTNLNTVFGSGAADVQFTCSSAEDQKPSRPDKGTSTIEIK